jgi:hypothetical protein
MVAVGTARRITWIVLLIGTSSIARTTPALGLTLLGADELTGVTSTAIINASITGLTFPPGSNDAQGEAAMILNLQAVAPMTRELSGAACTQAAQQLLIGLSALDLPAANTTGAVACSDSISGKTLTGITSAGTLCTSDDDCSPDGTYAFGDWREVLQMIYGGQNHTTLIPAINTAGGAACSYSIDTTPTPPLEGGPPGNGDATCMAAANLATPGTPAATETLCYPNQHCGDPALVGYRNPKRTNCASPVRAALLNTYANVFSDVGAGTPCRSLACTSVRHVFRTDDSSGASQLFAALIGLPPVPPYTKVFSANSPMPDRSATANPFCNAGTRVMNRGDADYLDLDPIRRSVDHERDTTTGVRFGLEQVSEFDSPSLGGNNNDVACNFGATPQDRGSPSEPGVWPDPNILNSSTLLKTDLGSNGVGNVARGPTTRTCLGVVLPISIPANFNTVQRAYDANAANVPVLCDIVDPTTQSVALSFAIPDVLHANALCPNGTNQPCALPYKFDPSSPSTRNFNCLVYQLSPSTLPGTPDMRVFNVHPVDVNGHYVRDNYLNPNIPTTRLIAVRQARVVSAYYRLHTTRVTTLHGSVPTGGPCTLLSETAQIGCLVKANSCSLGMADSSSIGNGSFALLIDGAAPTIANIQNLTYPLAHGLWLNAVNGFGTVVGPELSLYQFESDPLKIDPIVTLNGFVPVPNGVTRLRPCPSGL